MLNLLFISIERFRFFLSSENDLREQQMQQTDKSNQQQKQIFELTKKVC